MCSGFCKEIYVNQNIFANQYFSFDNVFIIKKSYVTNDTKLPLFFYLFDWAQSISPLISY